MIPEVQVNVVSFIIQLTSCIVTNGSGQCSLSILKTAVKTDLLQPKTQNNFSCFFMYNGRGKLAKSKGIEPFLMLGVRFRIITDVVVSCDLSMCNCICVQ